MSTRFDEISRILASPIPRRQALMLSFATLARAQPAPSSFRGYRRAINIHLEEYLEFIEPDAQARRQILAAYARASAIREQYQLTGVIPADPMVEVIGEGDNLFGMEDRNVVILLSPDPTIEASELTFTKPSGSPAHFVLIGGNRGFWQDHSPDVKFVSATFTLPEAENTLTVASSSWSVGKVVIVVGATLAAIAVATMVKKRGQQTGQRCECQYTCTAKDGKTFPYTMKQNCCSASEVIAGACSGQCTTLTFTNGTTCAPTSSSCVADQTCVPTS